MRGETLFFLQYSTNTSISIHSPRAGRDYGGGAKNYQCRRFQSTLPVRGETAVVPDSTCVCVDFNPLSPCGERHQNRRRNDANLSISIHSPRAGRDGILPGGIIAPILNFNPLSPCGERQIQIGNVKGDGTISIHSPRAGRDFGGIPNSFTWRNFNPLSPCGERRV